MFLRLYNAPEGFEKGIKEVGSYDYICGPYPNLKGKIEVTR